ncbi:hypothetical protein AgCh_010957 [Apium graveolens]
MSKSSTEAEYRAMSTACSEIIWLRGLLAEPGFSQLQPTPLHADADNTSAIQIAANHVYHERTKHIEVDCHSICEAYDHLVELLLGKSYADWGHVSDAVSIYENLISSYPDDFRGYLAKGIILQENGNVGAAERMFIQARFFAPQNAKVLVDRYSRQ